MPLLDGSKTFFQLALRLAKVRQVLLSPAAAARRAMPKSASAYSNVVAPVPQTRAGAIVCPIVEVLRS